MRENRTSGLMRGGYEPRDDDNYGLQSHRLTPAYSTENSAFLRGLRASAFICAAGYCMVTAKGKRALDN